MSDLNIRGPYEALLLEGGKILQTLITTTRDGMKPETRDRFDVVAVKWAERFQDDYFALLDLMRPPKVPAK